MSFFDLGDNFFAHFCFHLAWVVVVGVPLIHEGTMFVSVTILAKAKMRLS